MATYRQIHISFWQDGFVLGLTPEEKYFYLYLMTNSKTTQCGIYELPKRVIEMETGYNRETVDKLLDRFTKYRKIIYNEPTQEIMVKNWIKHNSIQSPKVKACIEKELRTVKYQDFKMIFHHLCIQYGYSINSLSKVYGEEKEEEQEKEKEKKGEENRPHSPSDILNNEHEKRITAKLQEHNVKMDKPFPTSQFFSYIGATDIEVIEAAILKSQGKGIAYCLATLEGMITDGITKESLKPKVGDGSAKESGIQPGRTESQDGEDEKPSGWLPSKYNNYGKVIPMSNVSG